MVNCNPETVSTDFDMADKLYFEPVFWEHLWEIIELEQPDGIIVQLGGQTALKLAKRLHEKGIPIVGTSFENMDIAEDRGRFSDLLKELNKLKEEKVKNDKMLENVKENIEDLKFKVRNVSNKIQQSQKEYKKYD